MIHTLFYVALWFLSLLIAWKLSAANEQIRIHKAWHSTLNERGLQTKSGRAPGAPRSSSIEEEPLAAPLCSEGRADNDVSSDPASSPSVLYDGEAEAALDPRPPFQHYRLVPDRPTLREVAEEVERPGLRVVKP